MKQKIKFDEPELERLYQKCLKRGIFSKLKRIHEFKSRIDSEKS